MIAAVLEAEPDGATSRSLRGAARADEAKRADKKANENCMMNDCRVVNLKTIVPRKNWYKGNTKEKSERSW